jgi:hypothetical protein
MFCNGWTVSKSAFIEVHDSIGFVWGAISGWCL